MGERHRRGRSREKIARSIKPTRLGHTLTRGVSRLDSNVSVCGKRIGTCCIKHVGMYIVYNIATTFTGIRGWIFFSGDRPEITADGRADGGDTRIRRRQRTWSSRKPRYVQTRGLVACTVVVPT